MVKHTLRRVIGHNVKQQRELFRYTQAHVAEEAGISQTTLSNVEAGKAGLELESAVRIARLFGCDVGDLASPNFMFRMQDEKKDRKAAS
ncbi:MAG TPA: helix-turn-helix transcriptional regulator [Flavobacteriales bacterium]|nr:helix-turn-helix transcriptional regulator [Flavobacteriales bacterium]